MTIPQRSTPTVLVVGGAGYIGSHVCKELAAEGYLPVTYDDLSTGHRQAVRWGPFELGSLGERARVAEVLARWRPVAAVHLASSAYVGESMSLPLKYYRNNVADALILLEEWLAAGAGPLVFSSSCAVYGVPEACPIAETAEPRPISPYGRSKRMLELMLQDLGTATGLSWMALRYFNAAGADPNGEIGEDHDPEPHLIPRAILAALGRIEALDILGEDYPTPDGTAIRDYLHVTDIARAHVQALRHLSDGGAPGCLNLGTGHGMSVREIVAAVERVSGHLVPVRVSPRRPGDPPVLVADPRLAEKILKFRPRHSSVDMIVGTALRWLDRGSGCPPSRRETASAPARRAGGSQR